MHPTRTPLPIISANSTAHDSKNGNAGCLTVDFVKNRVVVNGKTQRLTKIERNLLYCLVQNIGQILTLKQILEHVWGETAGGCDNYVHTYIWHLRQKIEKDPQKPEFIISEHGIGYRFVWHPSQTLRILQRQSSPPTPSTSSTSKKISALSLLRLSCRPVI